MKKKLSLFIATCIEVGCSVSPTSQVNHVKDSISPTQTAVSEFLFFPSKAPGEDGENIIINGPLVEKGNFWLTHMDSHLRKKYPERLKFVPVPKMYAVKSPNINAAVTAIENCLKLKTEVEGGAKPGNRSPIQETALGFLDGSLKSIPIQNTFCNSKEMVITPTVAQAKRFALFMENYYKNKGAKKCTISFQTKKQSGAKLTDDQDVLKLSSGCLSAQSAPSPGSIELPIARNSNWVAVSAIRQYIKVSTGTFAKLRTEGEFAALLAHELGHYYGVHGFDNFSNSFLYKLEDVKNFVIPKGEPSEEMKNLQTELNFYSENFGNGTSDDDFEFQERGIFSAIADTLELSESFKSASPEEFELRKKQNEKICDDNLTCLAKLNIFVEAQRAHSNADFEETAESLNVLAQKTKTTFEDFAAMVTISDSNSQTGLHLETLDGLIGQGNLTCSRVSKTNFVGLDASDKTQLLNQPLQRVLSVCRQIWKDNQNGVKARLDVINSMGLGWYTAEQMADEVSLEILDSLGMDPRNFMEMEFDIFESRSALSVFDVTPQQCRQLLNSGFKTESGDAIKVLFGDMLDEHHAPCYRIWNAFREIKEHQYSIINRTTPSFGILWDDIRILAKEM